MPSRAPRRIHSSVSPSARSCDGGLPHPGPRGGALHAAGPWPDDQPSPSDLRSRTHSVRSLICMAHASAMFLPLIVEEFCVIAFRRIVAHPKIAVQERSDAGGAFVYRDLNFLVSRAVDAGRRLTVAIIRMGR